MPVAQCCPFKPIQNGYSWDLYLQGTMRYHKKVVTFVHEYEGSQQFSRGTESFVRALLSLTAIFFLELSLVLSVLTKKTKVSYFTVTSIWSLLPSLCSTLYFVLCTLLYFEEWYSYITPAFSDSVSLLPRLPWNFISWCLYHSSSGQISCSGWWLPFAFRHWIFAGGWNESSFNWRKGWPELTIQLCSSLRQTDRKEVPG